MDKITTTENFIRQKEDITIHGNKQGNWGRKGKVLKATYSIDQCISFCNNLRGSTDIDTNMLDSIIYYLNNAEHAESEE